MTDSAERRARRKLLADAYRNLPSRETLQAAADLERARIQRMNQSEQMALQKGSLAVAVLSQVPRDNEDNKPLFAEARDLLHEILSKGLQQLKEVDAEDDEDDSYDASPNQASL
jgi:hypothetical protein